MQARVTRRGMVVGAAALTVTQLAARQATGAANPVTFDRHSLMLDGKRLFLWSGEFHYWRLPSPDLWRDVLEKYRAAGFVATSIYFHWGFHSSAPGEYDFTGVRDVERLMRLCGELGLRVIARPGPYIDAETDFGGLPVWLFGKGRVRTSSPGYLAAAREWYARLNAILARYQARDGGPIVLYQIENEYDGAALSAANRIVTEDGDYMAALQAQARADGIAVPFTHNDFTPNGHWRPGTKGGVDINAFDLYPQSLGDVSGKWSEQGDPASARRLYGAENPLMVGEAQGGNMSAWGGMSTGQARTHTNAAFTRIFFRNQIASGITASNIYMLFGGTSWGWLANGGEDGGTISSYDYGAAITEGRQTTDKYDEDKRLGLFAALAPVLEAEQAEDAPCDAPGVRARRMVAPDGAQIVTLLNRHTPSETEEALHIALGGPDGAYPSVPQRGQLVLHGRDARMLLAGYALEGKRLVYATAELFTHMPAETGPVAVFYTRRDDDGEAVFRFAARPATRVLAGEVALDWGTRGGDLRLNWTQRGEPAVVEIDGLFLVLADMAWTARAWRPATGAGFALVHGPALVRSAEAQGDTLALRGDTDAPTRLLVWGPPATRLTWNGDAVRATRNTLGAWEASLPGPVPVVPPALRDWRMRAEAPERRPDFDDSRWAAADGALAAEAHGFYHGDVWYRGRFAATGRETALVLTARSGKPGRLLAWIDGRLVAEPNVDGNPTRIDLSDARIDAGPRVISVLVENYGHDPDLSENPRGLLSAGFEGSDAPIAWRVQGATAADPVRGPFNNGGLFGERHGWHLPGYPQPGWVPTELPAHVAEPGITWFRVAFDLDLPAGQDVSLALRFPEGSGSQYRCRIFCNGWHMGNYVSPTGPQTEFVLPTGILRPRGRNVIAIASWGGWEEGGGLADVTLAVLGNVLGGVPVQDVPAPDWSADRYGPAS